VTNETGRDEGRTEANEPDPVAMGSPGLSASTTAGTSTTVGTTTTSSAQADTHNNADVRARRAWPLSVCLPSRILAAAVDGWRPVGAFPDIPITGPTGRERLLFTVALALARMRGGDEHGDVAYRYMRACADARYFDDRKIYELIEAGTRAHLAEVHRAVPLRWRKHQLVPGKLDGGARLRALVYFEGRERPWTPTVTLGPPADGCRAAEWLHFMRAVEGVRSLRHLKERWTDVKPREREILAVLDEHGEIQHVMPYRHPWRRRLKDEKPQPGAIPS
jgi:hypothetical protein